MTNKVRIIIYSVEGLSGEINYIVGSYIDKLEADLNNDKYLKKEHSQVITRKYLHTQIDGLVSDIKADTIFAKDSFKLVIGYSLGASNVFKAALLPVNKRIGDNRPMAALMSDLWLIEPVGSVGRATKKAFKTIISYRSVNGFRLKFARPLYLLNCSDYLALLGGWWSINRRIVNALCSFRAYQETEDSLITNNTYHHDDFSRIMYDYGFHKRAIFLSHAHYRRKGEDPDRHNDPLY